ncbi:MULTISPECIES: hypothetical protein [unclassified Paenibacillus]|uniref:hypothetical protein n=1 Tax=unclassified Paenibacillus TaxID=185978 RepID=UPI001AE35E1E|nr:MULTISPECIES: hypothetical protein [unclassified Paenibacillus]MBP1156303.1 hypothetical protein [Paenibacillus sp. PvP091]MBP1168311.1 hypothetical protein [Paenibacillus sp. PvR098]MBP2439339.1 hypothetical protein [Paenibacillus sp. PvP052]
MAKFWLIPILWDGQYALLGEDKILLEPEEARIRFVEALRPVHPRLLLSFKAELLLADEALDACGTDMLPFDLGHGLAIRLVAGEQQDTESIQAEEYPLSHCAEAYFNRLMTPQEASSLLLDTVNDKDTGPWLQTMRKWLAEGRHVILLRED